MSKEIKFSPAELAKKVANANLSKTRGGSGRITYLDRFVGILTDKDGKPNPEGQTRNDITGIMAMEICNEELETKEEVLDLTSSDEGIANNQEHMDLFIAVCSKCKAQVAAAVSNSNNSTALSYNSEYKDKYAVVKTGKLVSLVFKEDALTQEVNTTDEEE